MSGQSFVLLPVAADGTQKLGQDTVNTTSAIQHPSRGEARTAEQQDQKASGPLKQILDQQESLYKYINWEDPARTLGSYFAALSILLGAHYLPLTQTALKIGLTTLGVVSVSEFTSRSFGPNSLSVRLRPKEYLTVPEPRLNAVLKDVHDLVQYTAVQAQRILYGQDLEKTFAAFLGFTALYWLIKVASPFGLAITALTSLYTASLIASPRGRAAAYDAGVVAQDLTNSAAQSGKKLAQDGNAKAAEISSKARQSARDAQGSVQDMAQNGRSTVVDLSARASDVASEASASVSQSVSKPLQTETRTNGALGSSDTARNDANQHNVSSLQNGVNNNYNRGQAFEGGAMARAPHPLDGIAEESRYMASVNNTTRKPLPDHVENQTSYQPGLIGGDQTGFSADGVPMYSPAGDTGDIMNRPRGFAQ